MCDPRVEREGAKDLVQPQAWSMSSCRVRPETHRFLRKTGHRMAALERDPRWRFHSASIGTVVYLLQVLVEDAPLPTEEREVANLETLLKVLDERAPQVVGFFRSRIRERRLAEHLPEAAP